MSRLRLVENVKAKLKRNEGVENDHQLSHFQGYWYFSTDVLSVCVFSFSQQKILVLRIGERLLVIISIVAQI